MRKLLFQNDLGKNINPGHLLCIDTESSGLISHRDRICILQIYDVYKDVVYVIQFINCTKEPENLIRVLNSSRTKIYHYALTDIVAIMKQWPSMNCINSLCTKIMARIALTFTDSHGLKSLISRFFNHTYAYEAATDWGFPYLNASKLNYVVNDVQWLHWLYVSMLRILIRENKYTIYKSAIVAMNNICTCQAKGFNYRYLLAYETHRPPLNDL